MRQLGNKYSVGGLTGLNGLWVLLFMACVADNNFGNLSECEQSLTPNTSLSEIKGLYQGATRKITEDLIVEAYVISSDEHGNFYGSLHLQDKPQDPQEGLEVLVDLQDTYLFFPQGKKVLINARGLYLGQSKGHYQLGTAYQLFGQQMVGRIPRNQVKNHLVATCKIQAEVVPKRITLEQIEEQKASTWVVLDSLQFVEDQLELRFADPKQESTRLLENCDGNTIKLETSGYSDFYDDPLPEGRGEISAVLVPEKAGFRLIAQGPKNVKFTGDRCKKPPPPISSDEVFISEIADPDNNSRARFIELYNAGDNSLLLNGWVLERYTNANLELGSAIDLSGLEIKSGEAITLSADAVVFEEVYGFSPTAEGGLNTAADSNGDDNLLLRDPFGKVVDIFGRIGEDGSGTDHEFEDGRALRLSSVSRGNPLFDPVEWTVFNDTGNAGTINQPQRAPEDFSPGEH